MVVLAILRSNLRLLLGIENFFFIKLSLLPHFFGVQFTGNYYGVGIIPQLFRDHGQKSKKRWKICFFSTFDCDLEMKEWKKKKQCESSISIYKAEPLEPVSANHPQRLSWGDSRDEEFTSHITDAFAHSIWFFSCQSQGVESPEDQITKSGVQ